MVQLIWLFKLTQRWSFKHIYAFVWIMTLITFITNCGFFPEKIEMSDKRLIPLLEAVRKVDRKSLGFTPIPEKADVRLEYSNGKKYDIGLHIYSDLSQRTIAFKKIGEKVTWIGEQEIHFGPQKYETVDGVFNESLTITYETVPLSGVPLNTVFILYHGKESERSLEHTFLELDDALAILKEWQKLKIDNKNQ